MYRHANVAHDGYNVAHGGYNFAHSGYDVGHCGYKVAQIRPGRKCIPFSIRNECNYYNSMVECITILSAYTFSIALTDILLFADF